MSERDLEPAEPLAPDQGTSCADSTKADSTNRGRHIACQYSQIGLLEIVLRLIDEGVLQVREEDAQ